MWWRNHYGLLQKYPTLWWQYRVSGMWNVRQTLKPLWDWRYDEFFEFYMQIFLFYFKLKFLHWLKAFLILPTKSWSGKTKNFVLLVYQYTNILKITLCWSYTSLDFTWFHLISLDFSSFPGFRWSTQEGVLRTYSTKFDRLCQHNCTTRKKVLSMYRWNDLVKSFNISTDVDLQGRLWGTWTLHRA